MVRRTGAIGPRWRVLRGLVAVVLGTALASACLTAAAQERPYRIGVKDVLKVSVWGHDDLTKSVTVADDGRIQFPLVGAVPAAGRTPSDLEARLRALLGQDYLVDPQVTVTVQEYRSQRVFVMGEVEKPGTYALTGRVTLVDVLSQAGGAGKAAGRQAIVVRAPEAAGPLAPGASGSATLRVNLRRLLEGDRGEDLVLQSGDTVYVPRMTAVFILGEVAKPGAYALEKDTSPLEGVTLAGGFTDRAAAAGARILRKQSEGTQESIEVDLSGADPRARDLVLVEGDTLLIPRGNTFFVSGEVKKPGAYQLERSTTALGAITVAAGGFTERAGRSQVKLTRRLPSGQEQVTVLDLSGSDARAREFPIRDGDTLLVPVGNTFYVLGEVKKPGAYQLDQLTTAIQAVAMAGGFAEKAAPGRTRVIRTYSDGRQETLLADLNEVVKREGTDNLLLQANDTLYVPKVTSVFVLGEVAKPGAYTLEERDTSVLEAVTLAGGFTERAAPGGAKLVRKRADGNQETIELDLSEVGPRARETLLGEGDTLLIPRGNTFFVSGEVKKPGAYAVDRSTTAFGAITGAGGFTDKAGPTQVKLVRRLPSGEEQTRILDLSGADSQARDLSIREGDTLQVPSGNAFYVLGEVKKPGAYQVGQASSAMAAVLLAGGFTEKAAQGQVKLTRRLPSGQEEVTVLDLAGTNAKSKEFLLRDGDILLVPVGNTFYVLGEVRKPGAYQLDQLTTAIQAIAMAGGFTDKAAPGRTRVIRTSPDGRQETVVVDLNEVMKRGAREKDIPVRANDVIVVPESFF